MADPAIEVMDVKAEQKEQKYYDLRPGIAPINPIYVRWDLLPSTAGGVPDLSKAAPRIVDDDAAEEGRPSKKPRLDVSVSNLETTSISDQTADVEMKKGGGEGEREVREEGKKGKKKRRGMNKARKFGIKAVTESENPIKLCNAVGKGGVCNKGESCKFSHSLVDFLQNQPKDISPVVFTQGASSNLPVVSTICPLFSSLGKCPFGFRCRFLTSHIRRVGEGEGFMNSGFELVEEPKDVDPSNGKLSVRGELNEVSGDMIRVIRSKKYPIPRTEEFFKALGEPLDKRGSTHGPGKKYAYVAPKPQKEEQPTPIAEPGAISGSTSVPTADPISGDQSVSAVTQPEPVVVAPPSRFDKDEPVDLAHLRASEKKRINLKGERYLAPLTTVGNLPFRRLCVSLGATVTCSEMGLAQEFLTGNPSEWSLVRRHPSEKIFGIQICGGRADILAPACEAIVGECNIDFMDLNTGCPIDLVFQGAGSALLDHPSRLGKCLMSMDRALGEVPLTLKMRTGVKDNVRVAQKLMVRSETERWGPQVITLHGRSRQQRYSKKADWDYVGECVKALREVKVEDEALRTQVVGNGDAYTFQEYYDHMEKTGVDSIMVARGALLKPWIFTEIKERRDWDISSRERFDILRDLASYGLEHWGSDSLGVNNTRRFLCEALSFQYRYVPLGLLERFPPDMNDRPFPFRGRDELESLMASDNSKDWIRISEMFLGPAPQNWDFQPKHKSNSYDGEQNG